MKENATRCFLTACLIIALAGVGAKVWNHYFVAPADKVLAEMVAAQDKRIEVMRKRLQYAKTCVLEEKVLDHQWGQMRYNCEKIAAQVYPFPEELKKI
jgi:hypothetical protein